MWRDRSSVVGVALCAVIACGGQSETSGIDGETGGGAGTTGCMNDCLPPGACMYGSLIYANGEAFLSTDGCDTCSCSDGAVVCTTRGCPPSNECGAIGTRYQETLARAKSCTPQAEFFYCVPDALSSLQCGCPTTVNSWFDTSEFDALAKEWADLGCGVGIVCGPCPAGPTNGSCSEEGACTDIFSE